VARSGQSPALVLPVLPCGAPVVLLWCRCGAAVLLPVLPCGAPVVLALPQLNDALSLGLHRVWKRMTVAWSG